ncbi:hypothetical protein EMPS_04130 [Entomortierella parvispora]|uniref:Uncharacterized protein n=1 Tax=Entomortierella parvispora TaxID=205924 RepID=A0A9P3H8J3_9FUNG|nr:hypothetical protein EMPS_04130 [Entomortierella parvispora]
MIMSSLSNTSCSRQLTFVNIRLTSSLALSPRSHSTTKSSGKCPVCQEFVSKSTSGDCSAGTALSRIQRLTAYH